MLRNYLRMFRSNVIEKYNFFGKKGYLKRIQLHVVNNSLAILGVLIIFQIFPKKII